MAYGGTLGRYAAAGLVAALLAATPARSQSARIGGLSDINFGTIPAMVDQTNRQNVVVCSFRGQPHSRPYSVTATGSGPGGAFQLAAGSANLSYDVQWADLPGQTGGTMLQAGVAATGFENGANGHQCSNNPQTASLIVTIRAADLASARAGSYTGTLQITIVPE